MFSGGDAVTTAVGGSQPASAALNKPSGIWLDPALNVLFTEYHGRKVNVLTKDSNFKTVFVLYAAVPTFFPISITGDSTVGRLYVGSAVYQQIIVLTPDGPPSAGSNSVQVMTTTPPAAFEGN